jgi:hypothetical protein
MTEIGSFVKVTNETAMKPAFSICFVLLFPFFVNAQIDVTWGVPQKQQRKTAMTDILGYGNGFVYALRADFSLFGTNDPIVERYKQSDLSLDFSKTISLKDAEGKQLRFEALWFIGGNLVLFGSEYDKEHELNKLFAECFDEHCSVTKTWTEVARIPAGKKSNPGSFYTGLSQDSTHVLLVVNPPYDQYAEEKFTLQLIDKDLNTSWKKELTLPYKDEFFSLDNFIESANGDVYMLATISKDKSVMSRQERRTTPTYYHTVLLYDHMADKLEEFEVKIDPKFISDVKMTVDEKGNIICSGFYSNKSSNAVIGTFYLKIDKSTKAITAQGTKDFAKDFLAQFMSAKKASKGKELYDYDLKYLVLRDDGGAVLVAEQFYEVLVQSYDAQTKMYTYTYYYYYNDIIVVSINPDGSIAWTRKIPKYQVSRNDFGYYSSFAFAVSGSKMHFMFNDHPKNLKVGDNGKYRYMSNPKKSVAVLVTMDSKGNGDRQAMFSNKDLRIILRPKLFLQTSEKHMILYGERGSTFKLANVTFG